jgi:peroxiredoxin
MKKLIIFFIFIPLINIAQNNRGYIVEIGDFAPKFTTTTNNDNVFDLDKELGKVIMLQFTASWCSVCIKEMPFIENEIWNLYKDRDDFCLVGVDRGEDIETIEKLINKTKITYPICLDKESKIFELYAEKKAGITRNIIIDKNGKIAFLTRLFEENEFNEMKHKIDQLLNN